MNDRILVGREREFTSLPRRQWEELLSQVPGRMKTRLSFMTPRHHLVRYFVVRELPRIEGPVSPDVISRKLKLPLVQVNAILRELEANLSSWCETSAETSRGPSLELAREEGVILEAATQYPLWSPYNAFEAADALLKELKSEDNHA